FMYQLLPKLERTLQRLPGFWRKLEASQALPEIKDEQLLNHVVIVGFGRVGKHLVDVLESLSIPLLVIESDAERCTLLNQRNIPTLYGEAGNSEVLPHAHLERARALVVTVPDETTATLVVTTARDLNRKLPIIARAATEQGVHELAELGAQYVVHPELEGGLEMVHHTLLSLGFPLREVHEYAEAVRRDRYNIHITTDEEFQSLHDLLHATKGIEVFWLQLSAASSLIGRTLAEVNIRSRTGASVVALIRNQQLLANPKSLTIFEEGDRIGLIGDQEQLGVARSLISPPS
ncbi:MAG TPA: NAD-binding protein, partial [Anaerolineae bacterium]|nr:NAD-binding protein [Anaerolineae bacterium]